MAHSVQFDMLDGSVSGVDYIVSLSGWTKRNGKELTKGKSRAYVTSHPLSSFKKTRMREKTRPITGCRAGIETADTWGTCSFKVQETCAVQTQEHGSLEAV